MPPPADRPRRQALPVAIAALVLLPLLLLAVAGLIVWRGQGEVRAATDRQLSAAAHAVAARAQLLVANDHTLLTQFDAALGPEPARFNSGPSAQRGGSGAGAAYVIVFGADGGMILRDVPNPPNISLAALDWFKELRDGQPWIISPFIPGSASGGRTFAIAKRLERNGKFAGAAIIFPGGDILADQWNALGLGPDSALTLIRDDGWVVNRHPVVERAMSVKSSQLLTVLLPASPRGLFSIAASQIDGKARRAAYERVPDTPLVAVASIATQAAGAAFWGRMREDALLAAPFGFALIAVSFWLGWLLLDQNQSQRALAEALSGNRILLQEIHHRVKNNFQAVISLIRLQPEGTLAKDSLVNRIGAMSAVHQHMYETDQFAFVSADEYLGKLLSNLAAGEREGIELIYRLARIRLPFDQAFPLGLIVNELVLNAFKYAFPERRTGRIEVELMEDSKTGEATIIVSDNGIGYDVTRGAGLGTRLIRSLGQQIGGEPGYDFANGTRFALKFPVRATKGG